MSEVPETQHNYIGIVGPCSAGKSTLIANLHQHGYLGKHIAQEHSFVPDMWKRLVDPMVLIYLDVSYKTSMKRRPLDMNSSEFDEQNSRLQHAQQNADLYLQTDNLTIKEVEKIVQEALKKAEKNITIKDYTISVQGEII